ncbi:MAG: hypothetical protein VW835_23095, partial [Rickettsiales bacterium]
MGTFATSLQTRFLMIGVTSVLAIVVAFVGFIEIRQYSAARKYIEMNVEQIMDSSGVLFADAVSHRDKKHMLHLLTPILADPDTVAAGVEFSDGTPPVSLGKSLHVIPPDLIIRRSLAPKASHHPASPAIFVIGISHERIEDELIECLRYDVLLVFPTLIAIIVTSYQSLRVTVMRPLNRLLCGIESRRALEEYRAVDWET